MFTLLSKKNFFHSFGRMFWIFILLVSHIWTMVESFSRLLQVFMQSIYVATYWSCSLMALIFARFLDTLAEKPLKNIKLPPSWFTVGNFFFLFESFTFFSQMKATSLWSRNLQLHLVSPWYWWPKTLHHYLIAYSQKVRRALIRISWRSWIRGAFLCLQPVKPSFLNVLCNVDFEILINRNVRLTSNLGWNWTLTQFFRRFLAKVSVSSLVFHGSRPSETLFISSLWLENQKEFKNCLEMAL